MIIFLMMLEEQSSQYPNQVHCACVLCVQRLISFGEKQGDAALSTLQSTGAHSPMLATCIAVNILKPPLRTERELYCLEHYYFESFSHLASEVKYVKFCWS